MRRVLLALLLANACATEAQTGNTLRFLPTAEDAVRRGPGHPWQASLGGVNLYSLAKQTSVGLVGFHTRGGMPFGFTLHNNSQGFQWNPALGRGWLHNFDIRLLVWRQAGGDQACVLWGDHRLQMFKYKGKGWVNADGYRDRLQPSTGNNLVLTTVGQQKIEFQLLNTGRRLPLVYRAVSLTDGPNVTTLQYDGALRLSRVTEPAGRNLRLSYASGRLASVSLYNANDPVQTWTLTHDGSGRLSQVQLPTVTTDTGPQSYQYQFGYDAAGNLASLTNPNGETTTFGYVRDRVAHIQWPGNTSAQRLLFSQDGSVTTVTDPRGNAFYYEQDGLSRPIRLTDPLQNSYYWEWGDGDYAFAPSKTTSPLGTETRRDFDSMGRLVGWIDPAGNRWDLSYDANNNLTQVLQPLVTNAWGITDSARRRLTLGYNAWNQPTFLRRWDSNGTFRETGFEYDAAGNLVRKVDPLNHAREFEYDTYGNLVRITMPSGRTSQWLYESLAATAGFTVPNAMIDGAGKRIDILRDEWGRVRTLDLPTGADHLYAYDPMSRLLRSENASGVFTRTYNANGWLVNEAGAGRSASYAYYPDGRILGITEANGVGTDVSAAYTRDARGLMTSLNYAGSISQFVYDADGRRVAHIRPNGAATFYGYENGRMANALHVDGAENVLLNSAWQYLANGQIGQVTENSSIVKYEWDFDYNGLVREQRTGPLSYDYTWGYDAAGRRTTQNRNGQAWLYTGQNDGLLMGVTNPGGDTESYEYDLNGRLSRRVRDNGAEDFRFSYDDLGRLALIERFNSGQNAYQPNREYGYDPLHRRLRRNVFASGAQVGWANYSYLGSAVARIDSNFLGQPDRTLYTMDPEFDSDIVFHEYGHGHILDVHDDGEIYALVGDGQGSVRGYTTVNGESGGYLASFNTFGETMASQGNALTSQFRGQLGWMFEADAGLHWAGGSSFYDARIARSPFAGFCAPGDVAGMKYRQLGKVKYEDLKFALGITTSVEVVDHLSVSGDNQPHSNLWFGWDLNNDGWWGDYDIGKGVMSVWGDPHVEISGKGVVKVDPIDFPIGNYNLFIVYNGHAGLGAN